MADIPSLYSMIKKYNQKVPNILNINFTTKDTLMKIKKYGQIYNHNIY